MYMIIFSISGTVSGRGKYDRCNEYSLVIDIGGFTTDFLAVNQGGEVNYSLARSVPLGIQSVILKFEEIFLVNNLGAVKETSVLHPERVRKAMISGVF